MKKTTVIGLLVVAALMGSAMSSGSEKDPQKSAVQRLETAAKAEADDMEIMGEAHSGYLDQGASTTISVQLDRARCYSFIAVGSSGVADLSTSPTWPGLAAALPLCSEIYLPDMSHFIPMEDPQLVARYIREAQADQWHREPGTQA